MYNGKIVGYFHDQKDKNGTTHITDETGETRIRVIRNPDNEITGLKEVEIPADTPVKEINHNSSTSDNLEEDGQSSTSYSYICY